MDLKLVIIISAIVFLLLIILGLAIVNYSTDDLVQKYKELSKYGCGTTPVKFANLINGMYFDERLIIKYKEQLFSDSYNGNGTLTLCSKYANENNIVGLAICAHELGHALQFKNEKKKMINHSKKVAVCKVISKITSPLFILGFIALLFSETILGLIFIVLSIISFAIALITKVLTLKIEKDASNKAIELLQAHAYLTENEICLCKKFLNSAKQTYFADVLKLMLKWTMLVKK